MKDISTRTAYVNCKNNGKREREVRMYNKQYAAKNGILQGKIFSYSCEAKDCDFFKKGTCIISNFK